MTPPRPAEDPDPLRGRRERGLRRVAIILGVGVGLALLAALALGAFAGSGAGAAALLLLLLAATCGIAALYAIGTAILDDHRGRPVGRARVVVGVVLLLVSAAFTIMTAGVGG